MSMNKIITLMAIAIAMLSASISAFAQDNNRQRQSREALAERQARHIARKLALDDATTQKYVTAYCSYQKEVWTLGQHKKRHKSVETTEAEAKQANKARIEQSRQLLALREKYYEEYSKFLTQKQIERAYKLEQQVMRRLASHHRENRKGVKEHRKSSRNRKP